MANSQNISFYAGEDVTLAVTMSPVEDVSVWNLQFTVRAQYNVLPVLITKTTGGGGIVITNGPLGQFNVTIRSADTANLPASITPGTAYLYDIQRTDSGSHRELTIGTLNLLQAVNNITPP